MNENHLISIIVPVYNVEPYVERCVESIRNQTYSNLEIILVDDGSKDYSGMICDELEELDARIKVIHKSNGGLSDARNYALDVMTGEYVTCIDSDDFVSPFYVENLYKAIVWSGCLISCSWFDNYYEGNFVPKSSPLEMNEVLNLNRKEFYQKMLYQDGVEVSAWGKMYKSELFDNIRYPKGKLYEDIPIIYRLIEKVESVAVIPNIDYYYYQRAESIAKTEFDLRKMDAIVHMKELKNFIIAKYTMLEAAACCRYFSTVCNIFFLISNDHFKTEKEYLWSEIKKYRKIVLFDRNGRKKARIAALLSFGGQLCFACIYKCIKMIKQ